MHDEDGDCEDTLAVATDMDYNGIDTTSLNRVLVCLPIFLSAKYVFVATE